MLGRIDEADLVARLKQYANAPLKVGTFCAASNVTGVTENVTRLTALLHTHGVCVALTAQHAHTECAAGALAFWDFAAAAPHLPVNMNPKVHWIVCVHLQPVHG